MTMIALPLPRQPAPPKKATGVTLFEHQMKELDRIAGILGIDRSELLRWCVDYALPAAKAQLTPPEIDPASAESEPSH